jgi:hypothetical protein
LQKPEKHSVKSTAPSDNIGGIVAGVGMGILAGIVMVTWFSEAAESPNFGPAKNMIYPSSVSELIADTAVTKGYGLNVGFKNLKLI